MEWITFTTFGSNSAIGAFGAGDQLRVGDDMAKHLVDDVGCAVRGQIKARDLQPAEVEPVAKPSTGLNVPELKAALEAKGIGVPDGAKKPELVALLDGAA
jgi:hypothetical protein